MAGLIAWACLKWPRPLCAHAVPNLCPWQNRIFIGGSGFDLRPRPKPRIPRLFVAPLGRDLLAPMGRDLSIRNFGHHDEETVTTMLRLQHAREQHLGRRVRGELADW